MVVYDGTEASRLLHELMIARVQDQGLDAQVVRHDIQRDSESGLSKGSGISEFRGRIDDLAAHVSDVDLLMVHLAPVSHEVIEAAPKLRFIASERSSLPNIDVACARKHGIAVSYAAGRNARTVAEFTVGLMLDVTRFISAGNQLIKQGSWNSQLDRRPYTGIEYGRKTNRSAWTGWYCAKRGKTAFWLWGGNRILRSLLCSCLGWMPAGQPGGVAVYQ